MGATLIQTDHKLLNAWFPFLPCEIQSVDLWTGRYTVNCGESRVVTGASRDRSARIQIDIDPDIMDMDIRDRIYSYNK
jgi:hypothetical protein